MAHDIHKGNSDNGSGLDEFEDAVTTAIPGSVTSAFDHEFHRDVEVVGADLSATPAAVDDDPLEPGFLLSERFEIVELVHSGGMSRVYKAIDRRRHQDGSGQVNVAIKIIRESLVSGQDARLVLEREAARAQRLSHPNIVNVFDFDEHDGRFFMVMEWLDGESVNSLLRRIVGQRLDQAFAWQIIEGTAAGVQHAHLQNIVHADINPSNVFITTTHQIKLLDFGVARNCGDVSDTREDRLLWATKAYASPQVLSEMAPVVEDDIFSLGCLAYRLLAGSHPFAGVTSLQAKKDDLTVPPVPGLHEGDWQVIRRSLDFSRANRPKSAAVLYRRTQQAGHLESADEEPADQTWKWLLAAAAVACVAVAGLWWVTQSASLMPDSTLDAEVAVSDEPPAVLSEPPVELSAVDLLIRSAEQAVNDERFVEPAGNSATSFYREALGAEPDNAVALRGLRSISDRYVRQAETSLRAGSPGDSATALAIAAEVDPANPALELVDYLLSSEASQQLANARAAALEGDIDEANSLLGIAESYQRLEPSAIAGVAALIVSSASELALLAEIAVVDQRIRDGQLIAPYGDSALDLTMVLIDQNGDDARVQSLTERLGERLLASAAFASAAGDFTTAGEMINLVDSLGVLEAEVLSARAALDAAIEQSTAANNEVEVPVLEGAALAAVASAAEQETPSGGAGILEEPAPMAFAEDAPAMNAAPEAQPEPALEQSPEPVRRQSLSDLGIQHYVAPKFPRSARRSDTSGFVEVEFIINPDGSTGEIEILNAIPRRVFDSSAERAVREWRFAPREEAITTRVSLSFQPE